MSNTGLGVMISQLSYRSKNPADFYGKTISSVFMGENHYGDNFLDIEFTDNVKIRLRDDGQSCCEHRYMTCDDDLQALVGNKLEKIEIKDVEYKEGEYGQPHDIQFLEITTDKGFITIANHNEHNGYYGGFSIIVE